MSMVATVKPTVLYSCLKQVAESCIKDLPQAGPAIGVRLVRRGNNNSYLDVLFETPMIDSMSEGISVVVGADSMDSDDNIDNMLREKILSCACRCRELIVELENHAERLELIGVGALPSFLSGKMDSEMTISIPTPTDIKSKNHAKSAGTSKGSSLADLTFLE